MGKWRKKPVTVEAYQFLGFDGYEGVVKPLDTPKVVGDLTFVGRIKTLEDTDESSHYVCVGDYIVTGNHNDTWAVKQNIFESTYEPVLDGAN